MSGELEKLRKRIATLEYENANLRIVEEEKQKVIDKLRKVISDSKTLEIQEGYDIESVNKLYNEVDHLRAQLKEKDQTISELSWDGALNRAEEKIRDLKLEQENSKILQNEAKWLLSQSCVNTVFFHETSNYKKRRLSFLSKLKEQEGIDE
ncbi:MAG: hypothetical protein GY909_15650 [Oligoflexia bacterium]|nr:hypothetical protein [Oligoflexia bacterium]